MQNNNSDGYVTTKFFGNYSEIEFYHPLSNSLPAFLLQKIATTITKLSTENTNAFIVLKSHGTTTFCAGASFNELLAIETEVQGNEFFIGFANVINAMRNCPQPIIGRIQGKAVGGGLGIIAACDYTFATSNSSIKLSELSIGIGPFVIEPVVSKKIGTTATNHLAWSPTKWKTAQWAQDKGLFDEVHPSIETLDKALQEYCKQLQSYNPQALLEIKKLGWQNTQHWDQLLPQRAAISGKLVLSEATKKALLQFKNS